MLFEVIYKYQDWNFEYGYFDFCDYLCPDEESSLVEYLKNGTLGEWLEKNNRYMEEMSVEDMLESTKRKLEKHIRLWNSGKIKYSLSRMSPIMPQILEAGVNCYYINFSLGDIETCFRQLMQEILVNRLRDTQPAAIDIVLTSESTGDTLSLPELQNRYELLERLIHAFSKRNLCDFILREIHLGFRISTDYRTIEKITDAFTTCPLKEYIRENGGFDVCIGYGMGTDLSQAETAAAAAVRESRISTDQASYLLNAHSERIRLSGRGRDLTVSDAVTPYIRELSDRSGLSTLTIQKLAAAFKITGTDEVTTQDLARILHITVRSANRFVAALVNSNLARSLYARQINTKGRPSKVYKILIDMDKIKETR